MSMKVLFFEWASVTNAEMIDMLKRADCEVYVLKLPFNTFSGDTKLLEAFEPYLEKEDFDFAFSINYFDMIAEACHRKRVKYIAWTYDSPTHLGDIKILGYDTNYIFMFDRTEAEEWKQRGFENIYHLPLAVNYERYDKVRAKNKTNENIIRSEISFVGKLYENDMAKITSCLPDFYKAFLNALVDEQLLISGYNILDTAITDELVLQMGNPEFNELMNTPKALPWATEKPEVSEEELKRRRELAPPASTLAFKLKEVVTNRERIMLLQLLAKHFHLKLFSTQKNNIIKNAIACGPVDYYTNMPKVFKYSKINLNISLRTIESGIPLRCLDIMGCGGLLMSNYQKEFDDHFVNGRDLLIYSCPEDALEKAKYYLNPRHEAERKQIARNGYEKVREFYNYKRQFEFIWEKAELGKMNWK